MHRVQDWGFPVGAVFFRLVVLSSLVSLGLVFLGEPPGFFIEGFHAVKYFRPSEFECQCFKCGLGFAAMDEDFLDRLDMARLYAGVKFKINSAMRCEKHNRDRDGFEDSAHMKGLAVDIATPNSHVTNRVIYGLVKAGFHRIGIYEDFIHVDDDPGKPPQVTWLG